MDELDDLGEWEHEIYEAGVPSAVHPSATVGRSFSIEEAEAISASRAERHQLECPLKRNQDVVASFARPPRTDDACAYCDAPLSTTTIEHVLHAPGVGAHEHQATLCASCGLLVIRCAATGDEERRRVAPRFAQSLRARLTGDR